MKKVKNQFFVPHNVLQEEKFLDMKLSSQMLYIHLCRLKNRLNKDSFYRGIRRLSRECNMTMATIVKAKRELINAQYIVVEKPTTTICSYGDADIFYVKGYMYF